MQWLCFSLTSPNYNGISIPYTSLGHVATCAQNINGETFSFSKLKRTFVKLCVLLRLKQLRLGSGVWPN